MGAKPCKRLVGVYIFQEELDSSVRMHFRFPLHRINVLMEPLVGQYINVDVYVGLMLELDMVNRIPGSGSSFLDVWINCLEMVIWAQLRGHFGVVGFLIAKGKSDILSDVFYMNLKTVFF